MAGILNYLCAVLLALSTLIAFVNLGGSLSGMDLMEMFFRMFPHIPSQGSDGIAMWLLFLSHLGIMVMGVIGSIFYVLKGNGLVFSIGVTFSGVLGLISGVIAGWNVLAEVVPLILGMVCVVMHFCH
jgi:hypothetical protein